MSRRQRHKIPKGKEKEDLPYDNALKDLDRIQNRRNREIKTETLKSDRPSNMLISTAMIVIILSLGIVVLSSTLPQNNVPEGPSDELSPSNSLKLIFQDLDNTDFDLAQFKGQHILLDIMGTYCEPCAKQVEILKEFTTQYSHVVIISASSEDITQLSSYKANNNVPWKILHDKYGVSTKLNVAYIPTIIHFSPEYKEAHRNIGLTEIEILSSWVS